MRFSIDQNGKYVQEIIEWLTENVGEKSYMLTAPLTISGRDLRMKVGYQASLGKTLIHSRRYIFDVNFKNNEQKILFLMTFDVLFDSVIFEV